MRLAGRQVVVVGMGASGRAAAALARSQGADVVGVDLDLDIDPVDGVRLELGPHRRGTFLGADLLVVSPGVPADQPDLAAAHAAGVPVLGELAFADAFLDLPMAAITGTNGKSTVTSFAGRLLVEAGRRPFVGGNLGNPLSNAVRAMHERDVAPFDCLVVEVSSYQLEWPGDLAPAVGAILNLTPDHLARHGDLEGYGGAKVRLFERMADDAWAVLPAGHALLVRLAEGAGGRRAWLGALPGVIREARSARVRLGELEVDLDLSPVDLPGEHNLDNAATAALVALAMGADPEGVQAGLGALEPLPHRMQVVRDDGVRWIDDSKATNVEAARVGIGGLDHPAVVLLGGQAKGPGFAALAPLLERHRAVITFGGSGEAIAAELEQAGAAPVRAGDLADAVARARDLARPGDTVLLSPGCASFDAFDNFEHRGRVFAALAQEVP